MCDGFGSVVRFEYKSVKLIFISTFCLKFWQGKIPSCALNHVREGMAYLLPRVLMKSVDRAETPVIPPLFDRFFTFFMITIDSEIIASLTRQIQDFLHSLYTDLVLLEMSVVRGVASCCGDWIVARFAEKGPFLLLHPPYLLIKPSFP